LKKISFLIRRDLIKKPPPAPAPAPANDAESRVLATRMSLCRAVRRMFDRACEERDLSAAADILVLAEGWRDKGHEGREAFDALIQDMRASLERIPH
jgi:hypothetical protein